MRQLVSALFKPLPEAPTTGLRVIAGFAVAPFVALLPLALLDGIATAVPASLLGSLLLFPATLILGLPTYLLLRWKRWLRWYHFALAGAVAAALPMLALYSVFNLGFLVNPPPGLPITPIVLQALQSLLLAAMLGCGIALAFWLLVHSSVGALSRPSLPVSK